MACLNHGCTRLEADFPRIKDHQRLSVAALASSVLSITATFFLLVLFLGGPKGASAGTLQDLGNGICLDTSTGLMWQIGHSRRFSERGKAERYLNGLALGGYTDWRLPTTLESKGLRLLIDIHGNAACSITKPAARYWMKDPKKGVVPIRLELESFCRGIYSLSVGKRGYVRAVRTGNQ